MAKLTEEMKDFISSNLAWVATIGKDGHVDLGPKMSTFVIDDTHIGYHERTAGQMYRNLLDGSELVIAVANLEQKRGYRFRGNVTLHSDDAIYDEQVAVAEHNDIDGGRKTAARPADYARRRLRVRSSDRGSIPRISTD